MDLIGIAVEHQVFGTGTVTHLENRVMKVSFPAARGEKSFVYPDAFEAFLTVADPAAYASINDEITALKEEQERLRQAKRAEEQRVREEKLEALKQLKPKRRPPASKAKVS